MTPVAPPMTVHDEPTEFQTYPDGDDMGILAFLLLGVIAGAIAKAILPGDDPGGIIVTMLIGVVGAFIGGFLAAAIFDVDPLDEFFSLSTWLTAIAGSLILLIIYRMIVSRRTGHRL